MSYNKQNFVNGQPLTAQQLNYMENGLVQLNAELDNVNTEITNIEDNYATKDFVRSEINNAEIGGDGELDVDLSIYALKTEIPKYIQTGALPDSTIGFNATAEGAANIASGDYSHVEGANNKAIGMHSHAEGVGTIASGDYQHVQGIFNKEDTTSQYAFIVGNGHSLDDSLENVERSNAYTLDWDGNAWFAGAINCEDKTTTLANLGAAPAVYTYPSSVNGIDANTIVNEYHKFVINCANCAYPHGFLDVEKASGEGFSPNGAIPIIRQTIREWSTGDKAYRTSVDNGATWGEWIYETPPLVHNVEYRTTERLSGQPVYVRYIHIGSIPANNEITADVGIAANKLVSLEIMTYSAAYNVAMPLPHMDSNNNSISMIGWLTGGVIHVKSFVSFTGYSAFAIIKYTK